MKYVTPGVIVGVLAMAGTVSVALGKPALGAVLSDPSTAATVTAIVTAVGSLVAGILDGVRKDS